MENYKGNYKGNYNFFLVISILVFGGIVALFVLSSLYNESESAQIWLKYAFGLTLVLLVAEIAAAVLKPVPIPDPNPRKRVFYTTAALVLASIIVLYVLPGLSPQPVNLCILLLIAFILAGISQIFGIMALLKPVPIPDPNPRK